MNCDKQCYIPKYRVSKFKYCSRRCGAIHSSVYHTSICKQCSNEFSHISSRANMAKYCSRKCYYRSMINKGSIVLICHHCEKKFNGSPSDIGKRKYCSKACVNKENKKTFKPKFSTVRKTMISRGMIKKCNRCGYEDEISILGVHHKDRNRNNNEIDNLEVLCPNCHSLEHLKHISHGFRE